jgi:hypothetical protein
MRHATLLALIAAQHAHTTLLPALRSSFAGGFAKVRTEEKARDNENGRAM